MDNPLLDSQLDKLVDELESMYPHYTPKPNDTLAVIMYRAGQRSVVDYINSKKDVRSLSS